MILLRSVLGLRYFASSFLGEALLYACTHFCVSGAEIWKVYGVGNFLEL